MTTLTATEIEEIKERLAKATPGPWEHVVVADDIAANIGNGNRIPPHVRATTRDEQNRRVTRFLCHCNSANTPNEDNAVFIAAAPTDIARLLETVEAQAREIERLRATLEPVQELLNRVDSQMSIAYGDEEAIIVGDDSGLNKHWGIWPNNMPPPFIPPRLMRLRFQYDLVKAAIDTVAIKEPDPKTGQAEKP